jgi:hypothetical protein
MSCPSTIHLHKNEVCIYLSLTCVVSLQQQADVQAASARRRAKLAADREKEARAARLASLSTPDYTGNIILLH